MKNQPVSSSFPPNAVPLAGYAWIHPRDLVFSFSRSGGPGGQAVNKLSTRAELRAAVSAIQGMDAAAADRLRQLAGRRLLAADEVLIQAATYRSQLDNREACVKILRGLVAAALRPPKARRKTRPSRAAREKRLSSKRQASQKKGLRRGRVRHDED